MFKSIIALVFAFTCINAQAETTTTADAHQWEVSGGAFASYTHTSSDSNGSHSWNLNGQVARVLCPQWEVAANLALNIDNASGETRSNWLVTVGPVFNFMADTANSIFVEAAVGILVNENGAATPNTTRLTYSAGVGKRFEIVSHVTYKPEVQYVGVAKKSDSNLASITGFQVIPVQFSFLF